MSLSSVSKKVKYAAQCKFALCKVLKKNPVLRDSGVARGVAGVAEATPIFQNLFNKFGQKIWTKNIVFTAGYTNLKILPTSLCMSRDSKITSKHVQFEHPSSF